MGSHVGRRELGYGGLNKAWPLLRRAAVVHRRTFGAPTRVVAVVGSFGKTTTARCVVAALDLAQDLPVDNTLSHLACALLLDLTGNESMVLEVGIDLPGQMAVYARMVRPDVVVVTSVGSEHNRSLGTLETTRFEKSAMVARLPPLGLAVLNGDDANVLWMRQRTGARAVTFGFGPTCDVRATDVRLEWPRGTRFMLHVGGMKRPVALRLLGRQMVGAALAAIAVALEQGAPVDTVLERLSALAPTSGRLQPVALEDGAYLLRDEFKSGEETIHAALDLLAEIPARRKLLVLGDVTTPSGSQGPIYRTIGERLATIVSYAVFVGEGFKRYVPGALLGGLSRSNVADAGRSVGLATSLVSARLQCDDVVLIKGRCTQRLDRVALALMGRPVRCDLSFCQFLKTRCEECSLLDRSDAREKTRFLFLPRK